ncbi:histone-lysine N-methyltransferase NSD2-like, partial [Stegodyphus dumicola]|uniref:histone-lysine N-methyltransferase NSD2-like n=1 Tax=Stegodyphus dumicola TaxID=202533 RepID=UPI0015B06452
KNGKEKTLYHVQYFGKAAMRGWTVARRMFPFEGKEKFYAVEESALDKVKKKTVMYKKIEKLFRVSAGVKQLWNEAIEEALKAFAIKDINDRLEANVFNYYVPSGALKRAKELNADVNDNERQVKRCLTNENSDDPYCRICKRDEPDFACTGSCNKAFHKDCLGLLCVPQGFKCPDCDLDEHSCFVCKSPDGDFMKCSLSKCGRSYHEKCLSRYDCGNKEKNICPRHTCLTCYNENPKNVMARKGLFSFNPHSQ